jgi:hypothetical protein
MTEKTDPSSPSGEHLDTIREALNLLHIGHQNERLPQEAPCPYCDRRAAGLAALTELESVIDGLNASNEALEQQPAAAKPTQWPSASSEVQFCLHERRCLELREAEGRAVAAETALAEANRFHTLMQRADAAEIALGAAERRANDLTALLRNGVGIAALYMDTDGRGDLDGWVDIARAALDRQEQP